MKLIYRILLRISITLTALLTAWAVLFYMAMIEEVNDEVDDALDSYSEELIIKKLAGVPMPSASDGSNNQYYICEVDEEYAGSRPVMSYSDSIVYLENKQEDEPARVMKTIFEDSNNRFYELTVLTPTIEKEDIRQSIFRWIVILYAAMLIAIIIVNVLVFHRNMKPLYRLLQWIDSYKTGAANPRLDNPTKVTEFLKLNNAIEKYAERNERLFEEQKQFIGNASHEIQTPLAICMNRIEMLMDDDNATEKQMEELFKTHRTLEYITKLNKSLLLLSKIDNGQFSETCPVCLNETAGKYIDDYKTVYEHKGITVETAFEDNFKVEMNEMLASVLMTNLLKNAFVHNRPGGTIRISSDKRHICVSNTSDTDTPLDNRIFERFYQGRKKEGSTGLGLAISDSICRISGLQITYSYSNGMHNFTITEKKS